MLRMTAQLRGFELQGSSGDAAGRIQDLYFDDEKWVVRYLVADISGSLFENKKVLISPYSVSGIGWEDGIVWVNLSPDHIREAPSADTERPISRRLEELYSSHFALPRYWEGQGLWPGGIYPAAYVAATLAAVPPPPLMLDEEQDIEPFRRKVENIRASHLRSLDEFLGYGLCSLEKKKFGEVEDLALEEESWALRYIAVKDSLGWFRNRHLLVSPMWFSDFDWEKRLLHTPFARSKIEGSPQYVVGQPLEKSFEETLHNYFNQAPYWKGSASVARRPETERDREPEL